MAVGFGRWEFHGSSLLLSVFLDVEMSCLNKAADLLEGWVDFLINRLVAAVPRANHVDF